MDLDVILHVGLYAHPLDRDALSISVDMARLVHSMGDAGHVVGPGPPRTGGRGRRTLSPISQESTMKSTLRPTRWLSGLAGFFAAGRPSAQSLTAAGSPAPYGRSGELRSLPWEGLQLDPVASSR
jgi:hypothetical protein